MELSIQISSELGLATILGKNSFQLYPVVAPHHQEPSWVSRGSAPDRVPLLGSTWVDKLGGPGWETGRKDKVRGRRETNRQRVT